MKRPGKHIGTILIDQVGPLLASIPNASDTWPSLKAILYVFTTEKDCRLLDFKKNLLVHVGYE